MAGKPQILPRRSYSAWFLVLQHKNTHQFLREVIVILVDTLTQAERQLIYVPESS